MILSRNHAGTERHVAELSRALRLRGWRTVIAASEGAHPRARDEYSAAASAMSLLPDRPAPLLGPALARLARETGVGILHAHLGQATICSVSASALHRTPVVATAHFLAPRHTLRRPAWFWAAAQRALMDRVSAVIAVSGAVAGAIPPPTSARVHVVHNGIQATPAVARTPPGPRPAILYAGRLNPEKQPELALRAVASTRPECELRIAGAGPLRGALEAEAANLAPGRAHFLGWLDDLGPQLAAAIALVIPSRAEPFGQVALEAMRAGVPVVGFAAGALPEIVVDEVTGLLVPPGDVQGLSAALSRLAGDPQLAARLGAAGRARFEDRFTAERMAAATEAIYLGVGR